MTTHATFRPYSPDQTLLFPPNMADALPEGHLVHFIRDLTGRLDLSAIYAAYNGTHGGQPPYHPQMMVGMLLYGYCTGVFSSRKLEKATWEQVPFRVLSGDQHPDHSVISLFRSRHLSALSQLFMQSLQLCHKAGLVKLGHVALDGTKIEANASKHKAMSYDRMEKKSQELKAEVEALLQQAQTADATEDAAFGKGNRGDELPKELARRQSRLAKIDAAMKALEAEALEKAQRAEEERKSAGKPLRPPSGGVSSVKPEAKAQRNFTDPDARIMKDGATKEFLYAYNAQAVVDSEAQVVVAAALTQQGNDKQQTVPMMQQAQANAAALTGQPVIEKASMDAGYFSEAAAAKLSEINLDAYIATGRQKHGAAEVPDGEVKEESSSGQELSVKEAMAQKLRSVEGRSVYKQRKAIVEPVFGQIKEGRGFRRFLLRGVEKVRGEWSLICATHNFLKLFRRLGQMIG